MSGLIKAELIRLTKSKSMIVCIVLSIALGIAVALLYNYFWEQKGENIARSYALMRQYGMNTELLDTALSSLPENNLWSYISFFFTDGSIWLESAACVCAFLSSEYTMGTLKNSVSRGCSRWQIYLSKLISGIVNVLIVAIFYVGAGGVTAYFLVDRNTSIGVSDIILILFCYLLLIIATASVFQMLAVLFRKTGLAVAAAVITPIIMSSILNLLVNIDEHYRVYSRYLLMESYISVQPSVLAGDWIITVITALAYLAVSTAAGLFAFYKSEIR